MNLNRKTVCQYGKNSIPDINCACNDFGCICCKNKNRPDGLKNTFGYNLFGGMKE